jgi:dihydroneopterin aldolase
VIHQNMKVQDYEVWVHLGCTSDEQRFTQPVHFSVEIDFQKPMQAVNTDQLSDAIDYVTLTEIIKEVADHKFYHLVEHLCYDVTVKISDFLKGKLVRGQLKVHMHKIRVPVENLRNGVIFTCSTSL